MYDGSKFRFSEVFSNSDTGKTSGSGFIGVIMGLVSILGFIASLIGWWLGKPETLEIFDKSLQIGLLSAALLGVRKFSGTLMSSKGFKKEVSVEELEEKDNKSESERG